ncbi:hypothetical protein PpBr36_04535 [Pyricularia pennisetigena]|uniref:hypothetical protein n=1 Tax=Pyricularia pennisetigena TaxID=1578925 RepID=UPI001154891A|nr:hypothetical protein PpBr36_04535 [Pyricularia pennisetigena]TLS26995.1 hypothetical protein PpBr36_04535 [Pyricularia pennisetigena]
MGRSISLSTTPESTKTRRRILFLDAYDSFTNNITSLLTTLLDVDVFVLPIDSPLLDPASPTFEHDLRRELAHYEAVVCGPGPGSPLRSQDVGLISSIWTLAEQDLVPVLGICLGFQSLVVAGGGRVRRLRKGLHGMVRPIEHAGEGLFSGVADFRATLYHSLCGDLGQDAIPDSDWAVRKWKPLPGFEELVPLAWVEEARDIDDGVGGGEESGVERVLMAVKHRAKPFWGLQYHPESVCTETEGNQVVVNWFNEALRWNEENKRGLDRGNTILAGQATRPSLLSQLPPRSSDSQASGGSEAGSWCGYGVGYQYSGRTIALPSNMSITDIVESLGQVTGKEQIVLDSANASTGGAADIRGRYSIVALDVPNTLRLEYHVGDAHVKALLPHEMQDANEQGSASKEVSIPLDGYANIWLFLAQFHEDRKPTGTTVSPAEEIPFLGGFMGYITYEQGLSDINVDFRRDRGHHRPDVCFAWVTKSLIVDHAKRTIHIQHLHPPSTAGQDWLDRTIDTLTGSRKWHETTPAKARRDSRSDPAARLFDITSASKPAEDAYEQKVKACQEYIAAGESYELCLTDQTLIRRPAAPESASQPLGDIPNNIGTRVEVGTTKRRRRSSAWNGIGSAWQLFRTLRSRQPAPFASYVRLGGATLVSSSPERFLQYDGAGLCSMRPMKGTVRKSSACATLAEAERILHVPKEEAENLMIVDLVRHDLHGVCGAGNVSCRDLMRVEEYRSVFQMTTVVEGRLPRNRNDEGGGSGSDNNSKKHTGLDVLAASLPPGSMTGAPKKRSCEILQEIEGHKERSLYSGVVGYMCVSGSGDWSVTIRSMFRWDDEFAPDPNGVALDGQDVWRIGAGGAVTILSTPRGESEEMFTKLAGPMGIFSAAG